MLSEGFRLRPFRRHASPGPFASFATFLVCFCFSRSLFRNSPRKLTRNFTHNSTQARPKFFPKFFPKFAPKFSNLFLRDLRPPKFADCKFHRKFHTKRLPISPPRTVGAAQSPAPLFPACAGRDEFVREGGKSRTARNRLLACGPRPGPRACANSGGSKAGKESRYKYRPVS